MKKMLGIAIAICMMSSILLGAEKFPGWGPDKVKLTSEQVSEIMNGKIIDYKFILKMNQAIKANSEIAKNVELYVQTAKKIKDELKINNETYLDIQYLYFSYGPKSEIFKSFFSKYKNNESVKNYLMYPSIIYRNDYLLKEYNLSMEDYINNLLLKSVNYSNDNNNLSCIRFCKFSFDFIQKYQFELKEDFIKNSLKKLNRIVYPKINQGDDWKQLAVQIKLMLQSLE